MIIELLLVSFIYSAQAFEPCNDIGKLKADPNSNGYFECSNWGWQPMPCPRTLCFNPATSICDYYVAETRCNQSDVKPCEPLDGVKQDPDDCHSFFQCKDSGWVKRQCRGDLYFNPDIGGCAKPGPNDTCGSNNHHDDDDSDLEPCSNPGEIKPDTKHCDLYYECTDCGWSLIQCPVGQLFNPKKSACDKADQVKCAQDGDLQPCDKIGQLKPDPKHCDLFYECTKCGWALVNCEAGQYFDPNTSKCEAASQVNCGGNNDDHHDDDHNNDNPDDDHHDDDHNNDNPDDDHHDDDHNNDNPDDDHHDDDHNNDNPDDDHHDDDHNNDNPDDDHHDDDDHNNTPPPLEPCDNVGELKPDPQNCNKFYQCSPYGWQNMPCFGNLVFNPNVNRCDYPENYGCTVADVMT